MNSMLTEIPHVAPYSFLNSFHFCFILFCFLLRFVVFIKVQSALNQTSRHSMIPVSCILDFFKCFICFYLLCINQSISRVCLIYSIWPEIILGCVCVGYDVCQCWGRGGYMWITYRFISVTFSFVAMLPTDPQLWTENLVCVNETKRQ